MSNVCFLKKVHIKHFDLREFLTFSLKLCFNMAPLSSSDIAVSYASLLLNCSNTFKKVAGLPANPLANLVDRESMLLGLENVEVQSTSIRFISGIYILFITPPPPFGKEGREEEGKGKKKGILALMTAKTGKNF